MNFGGFKKFSLAELLKKRAKFPRTDKKPLSAPSSRVSLETGKLYLFWSWLLPLLGGLAVGWLGMVGLEVTLDGRNRSARTTVVPIVGTAALEDLERVNMTAFLGANPFRVTPMEMPGEEPAVSSGDVVVPTGSLAVAVLRGTLPGVGVWLEEQGKQYLVLVDESFDVYTLRKVTPYQATFSKGEEQVVKDLLFANAPGASLSRGAGAGPNPSAASLPADAQVSAAEPGGKEGALSRELVNQLMENPFDELKNVRLRPRADEQGLQVQWINKDSILSQLGVQKGDVVRSVNGIAFNNMMDITNSMNSLMNSDRFDVEVVRDGAPVSLKYVVH